MVFFLFSMHMSTLFSDTLQRTSDPFTDCQPSVNISKIYALMWVLGIELSPLEEQPEFTPASIILFLKNILIN